MNVGKSVKMALAKSEKNTTWLAAQIGVTRQTAWSYSNNASANSKTIKLLANVLVMAESEFIALGE